jgi:hypothetical protein
MKNVIKSLAVCIILAAVVGLSSCVKNDVSPEVQSLRQAQLAKLNAQVSQILADVNTTEIANAYAEANNALLLQTNQADLDKALAWLEVTKMRAQAALASQSLAYEQAQTDYELYLNGGAFEETIMAYGEKWGDANALLYDTLDGLYYQRLNKQEEIAKAQLLLNPGNLPWDVVKARLEADVALDSAYLIALYAAQTSLESVLADPSTLLSEATTLGTQIWDLENKNAALATDVEKSNADHAAAIAAVTEANLAIGLMETTDYLDYMGDYGDGFLNDSIAIIDDSLGYVADIADANTALVALNIELTRDNATLATANTALTSAKSAYNAKLALWNTAKTNYDAALANYNAKVILQQVAQSNYDADPSAANLTALTNANTALATATTDLTTKTVALGPANYPLPGDPATTATLALNNAQNNVDDAQDVVDAAQVVLTGNANPDVAPVTPSVEFRIGEQNTDIADANDGLAEVEFDLALVRAKIAEWRPKYDAAVLALPTLLENEAKLEYEYQTIQLQINANTAMITSLQGVIDTYENHYDAIAVAVASNKAIIQGVEDAITGLNTQIANNVVDKAWAEGEIIALQAELADIETAIAEAEALAAYWKKLLDDALAAQA